MKTIKEENMRGRTYKFAGLIVFFVLGLHGFILAEYVYEEWVARYNGPGNYFDRANALAVDDSGNVYVTGESYDSGSLTSYATVKYSPNGDTVWVRRYSGPDSVSDGAYALAVDDSGNVYVNGFSAHGSSYDYTTIKYAPSGDTIWVRQYYPVGTTLDYPDEPKPMVVDGSGNVYIAGLAMGTGYSDYAVIKYAPNGDTIWVRNYNGPGNGIDQAHALAVDDSSYVYVTGKSDGSGTGSDYATIKFAPNGDTVWVRRYDGPVKGHDGAYALVVDDSGYVYVSGKITGTGYEYAIIKYGPNGDTIWTRRHGEANSGIHWEPPTQLSLDKNGNVYMTGVTPDGYTTFKFAPNGDTIWLRCCIVPGAPYAQAVDDSGNVYVTGGALTPGSSWYDYTTVKYAPNGDSSWVKRYDGPAYSLDLARGLAVDSRGAVFVTGYSRDTGTSEDYITIKYSMCTPASPKAGDANADDSLSVADIIAIFNLIFDKSQFPWCDSNLFDCRVAQRVCRYDWNGDGRIGLVDCIRAINYVFNRPGGPWEPVVSLGCCPFTQ